MNHNSAYNEKELLRLIAEGDERAFAALFNAYSKRLYYFVLKLNGNSQLSDDLVQDVFTKLWLTRETLSIIGDVENYLFSMARNYATDLLRRKIRERNRDLQWQQSFEHDSDLKDKEFYLNIIDHAIEQLPEQQRKTWIKSRREKKTYLEIARELDVSRETVKTNLQYANVGIRKYVLKNLELTGVLLFLKFF